MSLHGDGLVRQLVSLDINLFVFNEWKQGICDKKKYRCAICPNRNFAPLTTQDMYRHLEGKDEYCCDVVGLYAICKIIIVLSLCRF